MKIIQVCQRFFYGGGQERHILNISKNLVKLGHEVLIVTSDIGLSDNFKKDLSLGGVKIKKLPAIEINDLEEPVSQAFFPTLLSYLITKDFDIIHAHGALAQSSESSLIAARYKDKPFIFTPHWHPWNVYTREKVRKVRHFMEKTITFPIMLNSSATINVSDYERDVLIKKYSSINSKKFKVIPNGVDVDFISTFYSKRDIKKKYKIPEDKKYVLCFGSVYDARKGIDRAINSFSIIAKKVPEAHLIILGLDTDKSVAIKNMLRKLRLKDRVTTCGYVSDKAKVAFLKISDVLISPTIYEAFGIVLAEAMFVRVPVVATKCGGVPYVMEHGKHGYLVGNYNSTHAFAKYTIRLLNDEKLRARLGRAGHKRVIGKFQWSHIAAKIEQLYFSLQNNKRK